MTKRSEISPLGVLRVTGEDATEFLQGQFSQDLLVNELRRARYGFWLSRKGRVEGDATIVRLADDHCMVFSLSMTAGALIKRFDAFLVADDVELADESSRWRAWQLAGPDVVSWVHARGQIGDDSAFAWEEPQIGRVSRVMWVSQAVPDWPSEWVSVEATEIERDRIMHGVPRVSVDVGPDDLPQEAELESLGVSFRKGCYLGQEVMARIQTTGRVRRRLVKVEGQGSLPESDAAPELWQEGKIVGSLRSRVAVEESKWVGLAMVNLGSTNFDLPVAFTEDGAASIRLAPRLSQAEGMETHE